MLIFNKETDQFKFIFKQRLLDPKKGLFESQVRYI